MAGVVGYVDRGARRMWMEGRQECVEIVVGRDNIVTGLFSYQMLSKEEKREVR
jgi:hypothetical protein